MNLRERIESFDIDGEPVQFSFAQKLARNNQWSLCFAEQVIREYKRFLYLGTLREVSPSAAVDEAWHLHLTYTESYWDRLCGEVLGRPFHHRPSKGGPSQKAKFEDLYSSTLELYRETFGEEAPAEIWPADNPPLAKPEVWTISKSRARRFAISSLAIAIMGTTAGCTLLGQAGEGSAFLPVLILLVGGGIVTAIAVAMRNAGRSGGGGSGCSTTGGCGGSTHSGHSHHGDGGGDSGGDGGGGGDGGSGCGGGCGGGGD